MLRRRAFAGLLLFVLLLTASVIAEAQLIRYQFEVAATSGPLAGQSASGTFAINANIIPVGGGQVSSPMLFSDFAFAWDGTQYTTANTMTSSLTFDRAGDLVAWDFGTTCNSPPQGGCLVRLPPPGFPGFQDWLVRQDSTHGPLFEYGRPDHSFGFGTAVVRQPMSIPTLSHSGQIILITLLVASAFWTLRRGGNSRSRASVGPHR
jgi:hypothetical protein